jgi:TRAP-type mannitol/chloroaromatic compound transport system substrate-binding protein
MVNEQSWQSLPADLQEIVRVAAEAANYDIWAEYTARSGPALRTLVEKHGVIVKGLPEEVLMACGEKANQVLNEIYDAGDATVRAIVEDFLTFREEVIPWSRIADQADMNARRLPFKFGLRA